MDFSKLKTRKKNLKLTTAEIAYRAELPVSTVSKIFTGETKNPAYLTIERIDTVLRKAEMEQRVLAYLTALEEYLSTHPEDSDRPEKFRQQYIESHNLIDAPIQYAVPRDDPDADYYLNLAYRRDTRTHIADLAELSLNKWDELIDGALIRNQAPELAHQLLIEDISFSIKSFIQSHQGSCRVISSGVNVQIDRDDLTMLVPDIVVVCDPAILDEHGIVGAPDWVIEVTSPATRRRDYGIKQSKYMLGGVREYWIIDLQKQKVSVFIAGEPTMTYVYGFDDDIPVYIYDGRLKVRINSFSAIP